MQVSKKEILHIANLAHLNLEDNEIESYILNLNYANIINKAPISGLEGTVGINQACNVFRKDEVIESFETEELLQNAKEQQQGMFKIPKVIN